MKKYRVDIGAELEPVRAAERIGAQLQRQRLRQWDAEITARETLLRQYLVWARRAGVRPLSRRALRKLGLEALHRRRDRFWLVAWSVKPASRSAHATMIAGVYASGDTVVRGFKAHQLAECIAQRVAATRTPWPDGADTVASAADQLLR